MARGAVPLFPHRADTLRLVGGRLEVLNHFLDRDVSGFGRSLEILHRYVPAVTVVFLVTIASA
jgi:hypothetical protein